MKKAHLRDMFKKASKSVRRSTAVVSPDPLTPNSSTYSAMKTSENTEQDPDNPEPAEKGNESSPVLLQSLVQPKCRSSNKTLPART